MRLLTFLIAVLALAPALHAQVPSIADKTAGLERLDGFFPLYHDAAAGTLYLEIPRLDAPFLYQVSLPSGLGSNDVGLDRGQLGDSWVVHFERVGPKVLLVAPNLRYRASSQNEAERRSVRDAFAEGILWGFPVVAESQGRVLVDATPFVVRDAHGVVQTLQRSSQGSFRLDPMRSTLAPQAIRAFPRNTEMEARLTFAADAPGMLVRSVAAEASSVTLRVRHSFVQLPDANFTPRPFHPGSGFFDVDWQDYSVPIGEELTQRYIVRHRLECAGPRGADGLCDPVQPIVYYLDPGTPEPVRSALLDGARWWADAFTAAGYRDAYRVEVLPDTADPLDVRYNVIQWVHRSTRGWSYGASVVDPRTGEILKGHVSLGSLRVRQDYLIAEALLAPYADGNAAGFAPENDPMLAMALARIRQLSAHEVGHTLGLAHNFAASTNDRASVMDYPAPLATLAADGTVDLSEAYAVGMGAWDMAAIRYGYTDFGADEAAGRAAVLADMRGQNLVYLSDRDNAGGVDARTSQWENGGDVLANLRETMAVRRAALDRFGEQVIRQGRPLSTLEDALVPLFLYHRYAVAATAKLLGGQTYDYALRGDGRPAHSVPAAQQRAALDALLSGLAPEALRLPPALAMIPPPPAGYSDTREYFDARTGLAFDPYAPTEAAAALVIQELTRPDRAARLAYQATFDAQLPSLADVWARADQQLFRALRAEEASHNTIAQLVYTQWIDALMRVADDEDASPVVRAEAVGRLTQTHRSLTGAVGTTPYGEFLHRRLSSFLDGTLEVPAAPTVDVPPGPPIGGAR